MANGKSEVRRRSVRRVGIERRKETRLGKIDFCWMSKDFPLHLYCLGNIRTLSGESIPTVCS
jgi:hypothetical protein